MAPPVSGVEPLRKSAEGHSGLAKHLIIPVVVGMKKRPAPFLIGEFSVDAKARPDRVGVSHRLWTADVERLGKLLPRHRTHMNVGVITKDKGFRQLNEPDLSHHYTGFADDH